MRFMNSKGYDYEIRLDEQGTIRIDHMERANMTLEEYYAYADAAVERPYFDFMESEIRDALKEGFAIIEITKEDLRSIPRDYVNIRIYREDRDRLAALGKWGDSLANIVQKVLDEYGEDPDQ